jgi:hypothetical protein
VKNALEAAGSDLDHVLNCNVLCISAERFKAFNEVYKRYFPEKTPARIFFCVPEWTGPFDVEVDCWRSRRTDLGRQQIAGSSKRCQSRELGSLTTLTLSAQSSSDHHPRRLSGLSAYLSAIRAKPLPKPGVTLKLPFRPIAIGLFPACCNRTGIRS